jgi:hypothetical protein
MTPYIRKHKLKGSFDYTTRLGKQKLMTLALLTGIINYSNTITRLDRKLMAMENEHGE